MDGWGARIDNHAHADAADVRIAYREAKDRDAAVTEFPWFLAEHHGPSPEGIALIVDHVMAPGGR